MLFLVSYLLSMNGTGGEEDEAERKQENQKSRPME